MFDTIHPEWTDADYKREMAGGVAEEAEYDVGSALLKNGHEVLMVGVRDDLRPLVDQLAAFQPELVFNGCESFRGNAQHEYAVAAVLEMHGWRHTGSPPTGLLVARNKSMSKKILAFHGIRVPDFTVLHAGAEFVRPSALRFPLIVKPLLEDASVGISQASVVEDDAGLAERARFIHEQFHQPAIAEELVEGRELYVGLVGKGLRAARPAPGPRRRGVRARGQPQPVSGVRARVGRRGGKGGDEIPGVHRAHREGSAGPLCQARLRADAAPRDSATRAALPDLPGRGGAVLAVLRELRAAVPMARCAARDRHRVPLLSLDGVGQSLLLSLVRA
ncbi:MAG: hypothetical protein DMD74_02540 [Gemmatimonadetes bacterium]|nr:MAG: hypothetical protein DMD74_02540 [Gemmatimonadota bacterium]